MPKTRNQKLHKTQTSQRKKKNNNKNQKPKTKSHYLLSSSLCHTGIIMARLCLLGLILVGILVIQTMADKSEPNRVQVQSVALSRVADQPVSSAEERSESEEESVMPEAEAPAPAIRRLGKHHSDKSVAGGGVIIGGLVTAIFAAVFCYIRVTRKRNSVH